MSINMSIKEADCSVFGEDFITTSILNDNKSEIGKGPKKTQSHYSAAIGVTYPPLFLVSGTKNCNTTPLPLGQHSS